MYTKYFGLTEIPFKITPDARFLWYSDQHKEAKAKIEYHLSQKDGPVYLSADVGLGKTSIAQRLREEFASDKSKKVVLAFAPNLKTANQFMRFIAEEFEVKTAIYSHINANTPMGGGCFGGRKGTRTPDLLGVSEAL